MLSACVCLEEVWKRKEVKGIHGCSAISWEREGLDLQRGKHQLEACMQTIAGRQQLGGRGAGGSDRVEQSLRQRKRHRGAARKRGRAMAWMAGRARDEMRLRGRLGR